MFTAHAFRRVECVVHPLMRRYMNKENYISPAKNDFELAISDSEELTACYDSLNYCDSASRPPEVLKRASLIMTLTAWETYGLCCLIQREDMPVPSRLIFKRCTEFQAYQVL